MRTDAVTTSVSAADFARQDLVPDMVVADFEEFLQGPGRELLARHAQ
jgi:hypothetical protein